MRSKTTGSPKNISSTTQTPPSSLRKASNFRRTACIPDLIPRLVPTINPHGIMRRLETPAARRAPPQRFAARHLSPHLAGPEDQQHHHPLFLPMSHTTLPSSILAVFFS